MPMVPHLNKPTGIKCRSKSIIIINLAMRLFESEKEVRASDADNVGYWLGFSKDARVLLYFCDQRIRSLNQRRLGCSLAVVAFDEAGPDGDAAHCAATPER